MAGFGVFTEALKHGKLLSAGEDLESGIASVAKEDSEGGHECVFAEPKTTCTSC